DNIAANDILVHQNFLTFLPKEKYYLFDFLHQIMNEFCTARFFYYLGISTQNINIFNNEMNNFTGFNFGLHSNNIQEIKFSFKSIYSLFDKMAVLLNNYFDFQIDNNEISFRNFWTNKPTKKGNQIKNVLKKTNNIFLRALYWLSKDLYEEKFQEAIEPEAKDMYKIRNFLEHNYLKIVHSNTDKSVNSIPNNNFGMILDFNSLHSKTLKLIKLAREAIIYLYFSLKDEENKKTMPTT
ncbi:MAG: hypothetical protein LBF22_09935, partial [Deltaproteobacteria bacterium]|nr:hypothetical protein [Deltaproteobacteria bacterium]